MKFDGSKVVSTNDMYIPTSGKLKPGNKRRSAFLRKSPGLGAFQEDFHIQVKKLGYTEKLAEFKESLGTYSAIKLTYLLGMPTDSIFYIRPSKDDHVRPNDVTNYVKCAEDTLSQYLKDDKYNFEVDLVKYENTEDDKWELYMILEPIEDYRIFTSEYIKENYLDKGE